MQIIRKKDQSSYSREKGRTVTHLFDFDIPFDSASFFLGESPQGSLGSHYHEFSHEIIFFPVGGTIEVNGTKYTLNEWDSVILEPGDIHGFAGDGSRCVHFAIKFPSKPDRVKV